jgi:hypothetical protein
MFATIRTRTGEIIKGTHQACRALQCTGKRLRPSTLLALGRWHQTVTGSNTDSTRPGPAGALLAARQLTNAASPPEPKQEITPSGNGDRNAVPLYDIPRKHVLCHFIKDMPLRVSALRGLGA